MNINNRLNISNKLKIKEQLIESKFVSITANQIQMIIIVGKVAFVIEE
jgi:hypothetical protein